MTIATINFNIMPQSEIERRQAIIQDLESCPLCGTRVTFHHTHGTDHQHRPIVEERSHCPSCACTIHENEYVLQ